MPESFGWPEGSIYIYTGNLSTSALVAYAENTTLSMKWGWDNRAAATGEYFDHLTGRRVEATFQAVYNVDGTLMRIAQSATAVHIKFLHANAIGSAGFWIYSGRIDEMRVAGNANQPYKYTMQAHANRWSGF